MLHEILLGLAGYDCELFSSPERFAPDLSPAELELLSKLKQLAELHIQTRKQAEKISRLHPSIVCRAAASSVMNTQLKKFTDKLIDFERQILKRDAGVVGAYNIVPLALVVSEMQQFNRTLIWLWSLTRYMVSEEIATSASWSNLILSSNASGPGTLSSGAGLIDFLRSETVTGYPDIEKVAHELGRVAETAWLKQLSSWILYGQIPLYGSQDFAIQASETTRASDFRLDRTRLPAYVTRDAASAILLVGKVLNLTESSSGLAPEILSSHIESLTRFSRTLSPIDLSSAIDEIRLSLANNVLQKILPIESIMEVLTVCRKYFLLESAEFAMTLITQADMLLKSLPKESTANDVLNRTWRHLSRTIEDDTLESGRSMTQLTMYNPSGTRDDGNRNTVFSQNLLPFTTYLVLECKSPLDLFMQDTIQYTRIHALLLSLRRAKMHLSDLWSHSTIRRYGPSLRAMWATAKAALDLLCQLSAYFEGDVVKELWDQFIPWVKMNKGNFEALQERHQQFLNILANALLLSDNPFCQTTQDFLQQCEVFANHMKRAASGSITTDLDADRSRKMLDYHMKLLVNRLRHLDATRGDTLEDEWRHGGIDRLLLKLNFDEPVEDDRETNKLIDLLSVED